MLKYTLLNFVRQKPSHQFDFHHLYRLYKLNEMSPTKADNLHYILYARYCIQERDAQGIEQCTPEMFRSIFQKQLQSSEEMEDEYVRVIEQMEHFLILIRSIDDMQCLKVC